MTKKLIFIAHSYHKKTLSYKFIVEYLKNFYDVTILFDEFWDTGKEILWETLNNDYCAIVIFQMLPDIYNFKKINNKNIIFLPMYDHVKKWNFKKWYDYKNIKIVSFSSTLHKKLKKWGFNSTYMQYFIEPEKFTSSNINEVFFWQRLTKININTLKKIFKNIDVKIHIHKVPDPGQEFMQPIKKDEKHFNITYSEWFNTKEEMQEFIKSKGIYIAPRFSEGIGISFLEAMAQGKIIVAHNEPTMNEYIKHGKTGFLCNFKHPRPIRFKNLLQIQKNTYEFSKKGYEKWLIERENIIKIIEEPVKENSLKLWIRLFLPLLFFDIRDIIQFKLGSNPSLKIFKQRII